ncbi:MAG TPA: GTP 3',8-cyclase MoaA [Chthoniobacterales bacterium]|nr:GTP 3',8-cyclase MoaA [Chthoniobacterales bacterium]
MNTGKTVTLHPRKMEDRFGHHISYLRVSITDRCNERCAYCMPRELQEWLPREDVLTYEETLRLIRIAAGLGVTKVRVTGGEPLVRRDILDFIREIPRLGGIANLGLSTNGTLLTKEIGGLTMAAALRQAGVQSINVSLDTLDRDAYAQTTGRDLHAQVIAGIDAARAANFEQIKLNAVLMRGRNEDQLVPLVEFAAERNLILRFIELMPVSTTEVLSDENFLPVAKAKRAIEKHFGGLIPETTFRTNGPATYYQVPGREQRIGFIGAMTNLHFCESCNKLRLTCDGKLRPCLGSYLEFDIMKPMRAGASDAELREFFINVVERKPEQHDFRNNYQPDRKMIAIGG